MTWQPPPPPPRPSGPGGQGGNQGPGGQGGFGQSQPQPQQQPQQQQPQQQQPQRPSGTGNFSQPQQAQQQAPAGNNGQPDERDFASMNYYELLQVNREAHATIIRYAYRFLAAMYHPDNAETGDADKFRIVTEAWRTLSDEGKRAAYDMSLGSQEAMSGGGGQAQQRKPRPGLPKLQKTGVSWNEVELRLGILQILLDQRKKRPKTGGASAKMIMDVLDLRDMEEVEFALWYLREKGFIEMGERLFMITAVGVDYIVDSLSKTTSLSESDTERKVKKVVDGGVPATIPR